MTKSKKERYPKDGIIETINWLSDFIEGLEYEVRVLGLRRDADYFSRSYLYLIRQKHRMKKELVVLDEQYVKDFDAKFKEYHLMRQPFDQGGKHVLDCLIEITKRERNMLRQQLSQFL
jgi:hypothetical protein